MRKLVYASLALAALVLGSITTMIQFARQPETTSAMRGKQLAVTLGCFACHGPEGSGGVADPISSGGAVPDWRYATVRMFVKSEQDLGEWILYGVPRNQVERQAAAGRRTLVPMPSYERDLNSRQLADLVAYVLAVSGWRAEIPDEAYEGQKIALRLGCFGCHGPSGMGGVANPGSYKGQIPPWNGHEYTELVRDERELREWILEGKLERIWNNPAARFFLDQQKTLMPAYHDYLSEVELNRLMAFIQWLPTGAGGTGKESPEASTVIGCLTP